MYDKYGEEGLKEGAGGHDFGDIFSMFGMGGGRGAKERGPKKGKSVMHPVKVTLEDLFHGKTTKVAVSRDRICPKCDGKGGKGDAV